MKQIYSEEQIRLPVTIAGETRLVEFTHYGTGYAVSSAVAICGRSRCPIFARMDVSREWWVILRNGKREITGWASKTMR